MLFAPKTIAIMFEAVYLLPVKKCPFHPASTPPAN